MGLWFGFLRQLLVGILCLAHFCCFDQMLHCLSFLLRLHWTNVDLGFEEAQELQKGIQRRRWQAQIPQRKKGYVPLRHLKELELKEKSFRNTFILLGY